MGYAAVAKQSHETRRHYWSSVEGWSRLHKSSGPGDVIYLASHRSTFGAEVARLGLILIVLQILDGLLTAIGMSAYGIEMEGNALLRSLMAHIGYIPALITVKGIAIAIVTGMCLYAYRVTWLKYALQGVIGLYIVCAVLPWTVIITVNGI